MMLLRLIAFVGIIGVLPGAACETGRRAVPQSAPAPEAQAVPVPATPVNGAERIQWEQHGSSYDEVAAYGYVAYVDYNRHRLSDVRCEQALKGPFTCTATLPPVPRGQHVIRVVAVFDNRASGLSPPLPLRRE